MDFEEQIDKLKVYQQSGSGQLDLRAFYQTRGLRGQGKFADIIRRFAYPVFQSFMNFAKPIAKDIFSDVRTAATDSLKKSTAKNIGNIASKIGQVGKRRKRRRKKIKPKSNRRRKVSKNKRQSGGKKAKKKVKKKSKKVKTKRKNTKRKSKKNQQNPFIIPQSTIGSSDIFK